MRYFLLDKILSIDVGREAVGLKCVTLTDDVLHDHFPDLPVLPGALITEGLAQLAGFLLEATFNREDSSPPRRAVLEQIEKMKFHFPTGPGDSLTLKATVESLLEDAAQVSVEASVGEQKRARGRLTFAMLAVDSAKISAQRRDIYKIWTRELSNPPAFR
jgi:3-hydroxyacyl-[acyl-carrier-protein] dehydratase